MLTIACRGYMFTAVNMYMCQRENDEHIFIVLQRVGDTVWVPGCW